MRVLVDISVIFNYLMAGDDKDAEEANLVMNMCAEKKLEGYVAFHSLSIIWDTFGLIKLTEEVRREWLNRVCKILMTASAGHDLIVEAVHNTEFRDFEDNLQECCAVSAGCDYIITVNTKDYEHSRVKAVTPTELVSIVKGL